MRTNESIDPSADSVKQQPILDAGNHQDTDDKIIINNPSEEIQNDKDKFDQQYEIFRNQIKPFKKFEFLFVLFLFGVIAYVWVYIYKRPIPKIISRVLGIDDTLYPEQLEKMKINN